MNKMNIPDIDLREYDYVLPKDRIAMHPLEKRDASKLLIADVSNSEISHHRFRDISKLIDADSLLILNETKVIGARLMFKKPTGGSVELLLVEPEFPSKIPAITLSTKNECIWECIIGGKKVIEGLVLNSSYDNSLTATVIKREDNKGLIKFNWAENVTFSELIDKIGETPLPPYIDRNTEEEDKERYQTVFAKDDGSVAAPTAGLHFTDELMSEMKVKGVEFAEVTLHVGPGTFIPISGDDIAKHDMHYEQIFIRKETIMMILDDINKQKSIISVGTTCCRTIESLYWYGLRLMTEKIDEITEIDVKQWEPYQAKKTISPSEVLAYIVDLMNKKSVEIITGRTSLIIVPGYEFRIINSLITNFHLPKSTLILLVAAFTGKEFWQNIYKSAIENDYRFLSYGDSSYLIK